MDEFAMGWVILDTSPWKLILTTACSRWSSKQYKCYHSVNRISVVIIIEKSDVWFEIHVKKGYNLKYSCVTSTSTLNMDKLYFCEMLVNFYQSTQRHIPEDAGGFLKQLSV
jgi:hypothetical protein